MSCSTVAQGGALPKYCLQACWVDVHGGSLVLLHGIIPAGTTGCTSHCPERSVQTLSALVLQPAPVIPGETLGWAVLNARGLFHQNW